VSDTRSDFAKCDGCDAEIRFAFTKNDRRMPVDLVPSEEGTIRLVHRNGRVELEVLSGFDLMEAHMNDENLYVSHFATCTEPARFRRPRLRKVSGL
jgi:hypothetical protein